METLSPPIAPAHPASRLPAGAAPPGMLPPAATHAPRSRPSAKDKDATAGMKYEGVIDWLHYTPAPRTEQARITSVSVGDMYWRIIAPIRSQELVRSCLLYTSPSPRDRQKSRMPSSA